MCRVKELPSLARQFSRCSVPSSPNLKAAMISPATTALLSVGINAYPRPNQLKGCVNDLPFTRDFLSAYRGLRAETTRILTDKQATKKAIFQGLQWLGTTGADLCVFNFSGHGARVPDANHDETDSKYDQAIVPVDFSKAGLILDDDLQLIFSTFPAHSKIVMVLDSCYSAKATRGLAEFLFYGSIRERSIHPDEFDASTKRGKRVIQRTRENREMEDLFGIYGPQARGVLPARDVLEISGCREFETSADAEFEKGYFRGAMSYFLQQSIRDMGNQATYQQIVAETQRRLMAYQFPQVPQLEGPAAWQAKPIYS